MLADIDVPEGLTPSHAFTPTVPFANVQGTLPNIVMYSDPASNSMLMLMEVGKGANPQMEAQMRQQMDDTLRQQGGAGRIGLGRRSRGQRVQNRALEIRTSGHVLDASNRFSVRSRESAYSTCGLAFEFFSGPGHVDQAVADRHRDPAPHGKRSAYFQWKRCRTETTPR